MENNNKEHIPAKLKVSDKEIEISGSEQFVSQQITKLEHLFKIFESKILNNNIIPFQDKIDNRLIGVNATTEISDADFEMISISTIKDKFENVVAINGNDINVIVDIPGNTLKEKMTNLILIYLFFKSKENKNSITFSELRSFCEKHAIIDKKNFSKIMNSQKKLFIISNDNKATLTVPGNREAVKLLDSLNKTVQL